MNEVGVLQRPESIDRQICLICGASYVKMCGSVCRSIIKSLGKQGPHTVVHWRQCYECECWMSQPMRIALCSPKCRRARAKRYGTLTGQNDHFKKRARHHGVVYEWVESREIYIRDEWMCQICGIEVWPYDPETFPTKNDMATIDHVVAMVNGGPHLLSNLQTACFRCNTKKGAS